MHSISDKDFTYHPSLQFIGDFEQIETNIVDFIDNMNGILAQIRETSDVVLSECDQVSNASQSLAQGASEQAASVEELSATIAQVTTTANEISESALSVDNEAKASKSLLLDSNQQMEEMVVAIDEISRKSDEIEKIICEVKDGLRQKRIPFKNIKTGIMIETPAAVMISRELAKLRTIPL